MKSKASKTASDILKPVFADFRRQAKSAIEAACADIKNVLRVRYDSEPKCRPVGLPAPRIQLRWEDDGECICHHEMIFPLGEWDIRNDTKTGVAVIELGRTRVSGDAPWDRMPIEMRMPFRAGAHARWDAKAFGGLPIYVISPSGHAELVPPKDATP